jgi:uncharacterized protein YecE (DUF72 family)
MESESNVFIGCAGWSVSSAYATNPAIPKDGSHLQRYSAALSAVEINSSFYRPHRPETYVRWRDTTPAGFKFSVKIPKTITHEKKLVDIEDILDRFVGEVMNLEEKLGCLLLQLPPKLKFDLSTASRFLEMLRSKTKVKVVCEPRHPSWFQNSVNELFEIHNIARVIADPSVDDTEDVPLPKSDTIYLRLHGSPEIYRSTYSETYLDELVGLISRYVGKGLKVWCIFDNTANGEALGNALYLQTRIFMSHYKNGFRMSMRSDLLRQP